MSSYDHQSPSGQRLSPADEISLMRFYAMLYITRDGGGSPNMRRKIGPAHAVYVLNALALASSLRERGYEFSLVTNSPDLVEKTIREVEGRLFDLIEFSPSSAYPKTSHFYSTHFKLDAFRVVAEHADTRLIGFIDLDTILLHDSWITRCACVPKRGLLAYDLTDQIHAQFGPQAVGDDIVTLLGREPRHLRRFGGEFIVGRKREFHLLADKVKALIPRYTRHIDIMRHTGDEIITTAALIDLAETGEIDLVDVNEWSGKTAVLRWWSGRTKYRQRPVGALSEVGLLHLPADKDFLAGWAVRPFNSDQLIALYQGHVRRKNGFKRLVLPIANLLDGHTSFLPYK